jgi:hypothetical protein
MPTYKTKERELAYQLFVEEGIQDLDALAQRVGLSVSTLRKFLSGPEAKRDHRLRCEEAKRLYVEQGVTKIDTICTAARIHPNLWKNIYRASWDQERASYVAAHPTLYTTGQLLMQAAEHLLTSVQAKGYTGESVKQLVELANNFNRLRTGEHRIEMCMVGVTDFSEWIREHARAFGWKEENVALLCDALLKYRDDQLAKLRALER